MSLLTIIQDAAVKTGIDKPSSVIGNTETGVMELLAFAQEEGKWLMRKFNWRVLTTEKTFSATAAETQTGAIPSDLHRFVNETFWNRTKKSKLIGPLTPQEWQNIKATTVNPATDCFRVRGADILMNPPPTASDTMAYEYISKNWCQSAAGTAQEAWAADTDTGKLNEDLLCLGTIVRYKMSKGLPYDEDLAKYDAFVLSDELADKPKKTINMAGQEDYVPSIGIQEGAWNVA